MNPLKRRVLFLVVLLGIAWVGFRFLRSGRETPETLSARGPVASVQAVPVKKGTITEDITAYGTVVPVPGTARSITTAYECRIRHVAVARGQRVARGEPLVEIEPSADCSSSWRI